jgi:hypothetical protein
MGAALSNSSEQGGAGFRLLSPDERDPPNDLL